MYLHYINLKYRITIVNFTTISKTRNNATIVKTEKNNEINEMCHILILRDAVAL